MKVTRLSSSLGVVLFILAFASALAQAQQAYVLQSQGLVRVNGVAAPHSIVVFPGDVVETAKGAAAKISAPGTSMLVAENSRVSLSNGKLVVVAGSGLINTGLGAALATSNPSESVTVAPSGEGSPTFGQLSDDPITTICRTARECVCRTAKDCDHTR